MLDLPFCSFALEPSGVGETTPMTIQNIAWPDYDPGGHKAESKLPDYTECYPTDGSA